MVDHAPSERYRKLVQPPRHRVGWLPSISRREKFGVVKILYHFSHNKNVLGMDGRWQSQNSVHVLNLPRGTVRLTVVTMENAMLGMVRHYQRDGWGGRVLVEVLQLTQKGFVVRVWTHGYRGTEGPRAHEFHSWFQIRSRKGRRNARREDFFQRVTQRTQPGVPRKAVLTEGQRGNCSERGLFSWLFSVVRSWRTSWRLWLESASPRWGPEPQAFFSWSVSSSRNTTEQSLFLAHDFPSGGRQPGVFGKVLVTEWENIKYVWEGLGMRL